MFSKSRAPLALTHALIRFGETHNGSVHRILCMASHSRSTEESFLALKIF